LKVSFNAVMIIFGIVGVALFCYALHILKNKPNPRNGCK